MTSNQEDYNTFYLQPGYIFISKEPYIITTVLGSCVSVCLRDRKRKYGGMNHYIYDVPLDDSLKAIYGSVSIPYMIRTMEGFGSGLKDLDAYVIGGSRSNTLSSSTVGSNNIEIARDILGRYDITIKRVEVDGKKGKKVIFNTYTGELKVNTIK